MSNPLPINLLDCSLENLDELYDNELCNFPTIIFPELEFETVKTSLSGNEMFQIYHDVITVNKPCILSNINYNHINNTMISLVEKLSDNYDFSEKSKKFIIDVKDHLNLMGKYEFLINSVDTIDSKVKELRLMIFYQRILNFIEILRNIEADLYFKLCDEMNYVDNFI